MQIYCLTCKKHTDNISSNKVVRQFLKHANCMVDK